MYTGLTVTNIAYFTIQHVWFDVSLSHDECTKRKDLLLLKIATSDSSPANDGKGGICGEGPSDESTLIANGMEKSDGSLHQNFVGKFNNGSLQYES